MRILLFAPPIIDKINGRYKPIAMDAVSECPPYGIYLLSSILKHAGHEVILADLIAQGSRSIKKYLPYIKNCDLVGIGAASLNWPTAIDLIMQTRRQTKDLPIVLGGIHPTMFDRYILTTFPVQYVIRGEAEVALPVLCNVLEEGKDLRTVPNLSWCDRDGQIVRNPIAPLLSGEEIGAFPLPDYNLLPPNIYKGLSIESSRGCAFDCSYCSTSYRRSWRSIPADKFVDRLEKVMQYVELTKTKMIHIVDDEFSTDPKRATEIARLIRQRGLSPKLLFDSRAKDIISGDFIENIAEYTHRFLVGAECGYDEGLKLVGKGATCKDLENAALKLNQVGISERASFSFILGLPWETAVEVGKTVRFATYLHSKYGVRIMLQWYCMIPGSKLWHQERQNQFVNETMYNCYGFFRDLYLFRSGVRLKPNDIWEIGKMIAQLKWLSDLRYPGQEMIESGMPDSIMEHFPEDLCREEDTDLISLRQVSHPK